jgi:VCBS repeat protein/ASPIC/UnbV protein
VKMAWKIGIGVALAAAVAAAVVLLRRPAQKPFDMVAELKSIADREGVWDNQWDQAPQKVDSLNAALKAERDPGRRFELQRELARHYLFANAPEGALALLEQMQNEVKDWPREFREAVKADLAFAYFRLGEIQNCNNDHNADSCLFPVAGKGIHQQRLGMSEAARLYAELLADPKVDPEAALMYRWLLNLSYMTLGQYPDKVPRKWLIPPETFKSDYDIGRFNDVAAERGVQEFGVAGGIVLEDFDNDGWLDLMMSHMGVRDQLEYFHNNGDGTFTRKTEQAGLKGIVGGLNMVQADYNNDGCIDVFIPRGAWLHDHGKFPPSLLRNNCNGTFTDVTAEAGLLNYFPTQAATWADVDNDGFVDLFVGNEVDREKVSWPASAKNFELYMNNRDGTFRELGPAETGIQLEGMVKAAVWGDYDNDGWPDLYVSILGRPNRLFRNLGGEGKPARFADVTTKAGVAEPLFSFTTWFFDYDNDGWLDIFVSGYTALLPNIVREYLGDKEHAKGERPRLYHNNGDGTFTDKSREAHLDKLLLSMGSNYGDLDNDGWLDFYLGTGVPPLTTLVPNRMFRNDRGRVFQDVTTSGGFGNLQKGHGVAFGDLSNNGNQDVVEVMGGAYNADKFWSSIYQNPGHGNHWVKYALTGVKSNRYAVGGRIKTVVSNTDGSRRDIHWVVSSGGSFGAQTLRPHVGLGQASAIELVEIRWPSGLVQQFKGPFPPDRTYQIREGDPELKPAAAPVRAAASAKN